MTAATDAPKLHCQNQALYETGLLFTLMNPWPADRAKAMLANWRRVRAEVTA